MFSGGRPQTIARRPVKSAASLRGSEDPFLSKNRQELLSPEWTRDCVPKLPRVETHLLAYESGDQPIQFSGTVGPLGTKDDSSLHTQNGCDVATLVIHDEA
jgi:hypothetical protein